MRKFIKTKISDFINEILLQERFTINNLPESIILLSEKSKGGYTFLLYDKNHKLPIGYISFCFYPSINSYTVGGAYSKNGYGPFLYECVMTHVYPSGLSMNRSSSTSGDAIEVWNKFLKRIDVKHERMYSDEITHKKDDWIKGGLFDDDPEYRQKIFDLEDTRFFYSFGKEKLNNLIEIGLEYMKVNNITPKDVEYMSWDLE